MQKILLRRTCRMFLSGCLFFLIIMGVYFFIKTVLLEKTVNGFEASEDLYSMILALFPVQSILVEKNVKLPDAVFVMPFSRTERIDMVKKLYGISIVVISLIIGGFIFGGKLWQIFVMKEGTIYWSNMLFSMLFFISINYILGYTKYFEAVNSLHAASVPFCVIIQIGLLAVTGDIDKEIAGIGRIVLLVMLLLFYRINGYFHKKYYLKMMEYYADYEQSTQKLARK